MKRLTAPWTFAVLLLTLIPIILPAQEIPGGGTAGDASLQRPQLPTGTAIRIKLEAGLSTATANQSFSGSLTEAVVFEGKTIIPAGATLTGSVFNASSPRRIKGHPSLELRTREIVFPDGEKRPVNAVAVDTSDPQRFDVDEEGRIRIRVSNKADNREALLGTAAGAGVGAYMGGGPGALIGAARGAGTTTTHRLARRHSGEIPAGTEIILELKRPMEIGR